jgi:hypothetical protein
MGLTGITSLFRFDCLDFIYILWHVDSLLGNDRETNNETTTVAMQ